MKNLLYAVVILLGIVSCKKSKINSFTVAFYNVENLFDTKDDPNTYDEQFTPKGDKKWDSEKYNTKLTNLAKVISDMSEGEAPSFLGVCEIENRLVLEDLASDKQLKRAHYKIVHVESPDERGIDVAFFYDSRIFTVNNQEALQPDLSAFKDKTRDILHVDGTLASGERLHFIINHWPSRGGGKRESEPKRIQAAKALSSIKDKILSQEPTANIIVMGDFNDEPSNNSIAKHLDISCTPTITKPYQLFNVFCQFEKEGKGSYKYRQNWNMLDQIMISDNLLRNSSRLHFVTGSARIKNEYWMQQHGNKYEGSPLRTYGGPNYLAGYSDHFPVSIRLKLSSEGSSD
jgi:endonuclease/exonuclease/phosphatase family metal-dependent hydrolase